jgi:hypothetical protein
LRVIGAKEVGQGLLRLLNDPIRILTRGKHTVPIGIRFDKVSAHGVDYMMGDLRARSTVKVHDGESTVLAEEGWKLPPTLRNVQMFNRSLSHNCGTSLFRQDELY